MSLRKILISKWSPDYDKSPRPQKIFPRRFVEILFRLFKLYLFETGRVLIFRVSRTRRGPLEHFPSNAENRLNAFKRPVKWSYILNYLKKAIIEEAETQFRKRKNWYRINKPNTEYSLRNYHNAGEIYKACCIHATRLLKYSKSTVGGPI